MGSCARKPGAEHLNCGDLDRCDLERVCAEPDGVCRHAHVQGAAVAGLRLCGDALGVGGVGGCRSDALVWQPRFGLRLEVAVPRDRGRKGRAPVFRGDGPVAAEADPGARAEVRQLLARLEPPFNTLP